VEAFHLTGLWGEGRSAILTRYFPDVDSSRWGDVPQGTVRATDFFLDLRGQIRGEDARWSVWQWSDNPLDGRARRHELWRPRDPWMFFGTPKGIWRLLDSAVGEDVPLMTALEYANIMRGRAPHDLTRDELVIERVVAVARYLHLQCQNLFEALQEEQGAANAIHSELEAIRATGGTTHYGGESPVAESKGELAESPSPEDHDLQEDLDELRRDLRELSDDLEGERKRSSQLENDLAWSRSRIVELEQEWFYANDNVANASKEASDCRLTVERTNNSLLLVTSERDSCIQQLKLARDAASTAQQEHDQRRADLVTARNAAQGAELERNSLRTQLEEAHALTRLAEQARDQALRAVEAARNTAASQPPAAAAAADELAHLKREITESLGEQALLRWLARSRQSATTVIAGEGSGTDYSAAMPAAYAASDTALFIKSSSPAIPVMDTPLHSGRRSGTWSESLRRCARSTLSMRRSASSTRRSDGRQP